MNTSIYLYASPLAADATCVRELEARFKELEVDPNRVKTLPDQSYLGKALNDEQGILVIPGGKTILVLDDLNDHVERIRSRVDRGWNYLGFCAGANVACYNLMKINPHTATMENIAKEAATNGYQFLKLLPIAAWMPVYGVQTGDKVVKVAASNEPFSCFWSDGSKWNCSKDNEAKVTVEARYDDCVHKSACAISGTYGKGTVVCSAVHPELCLDEVTKADKNRQAFLKHLFAKSKII